MEKAVTIANKQFPDAQILINSPIHPSFEEIVDFANFMVETNPSLVGQFLIGSDYYYKRPSTPNLPFIGFLDSIAWWEIVGYRVKNTTKRAVNSGHRLEDTEVQFESWGWQQTPGKSASEFQYAIKRVIDNTLDLDLGSIPPPTPEGIATDINHLNIGRKLNMKPQMPVTNVSLWRPAQLAIRMMQGTLSEEDRRNIKLIQTVNGPKTKGPK